MKINSINNMNTIKDDIQVRKDKVDSSEKVNTTSTDVFEKAKPEEAKTTYDKATIDKIKKDSYKSFDALKKMVEQLLKSQGKSVNNVMSDKMIDIDAATRTEASALIADDGPLGVEAMSDKIVDFAIAISGGDKSKLATLKNAIDKGFTEARRALGGLPDISMKTYDRIMEKLDIWEKGNEEGVQ